MVNFGLFGLVLYQSLSSVPALDKVLNERSEVLTDLIQGQVLIGAFEPDKHYHLATIRALLSAENRSKFRERFEDILLSNSETLGFAGTVEINPLGAALRDPETFPIDEIRAGISTAKATGQIGLAADGFCVPIKSAPDENGRQNTVAAAWFKTSREVGTTSLFAYFLPMIIGTVVLLGFSFWVFDRGIVMPLRRLGAAVTEVGAGHYDVRVEPLRGSRELDTFVEAFNSMAEKVQNQHQVLEQEVHAATEEAKRKERALLMSARLASMGTLAAGIAHEINNPIGGMINAIRRVAKNEHLSERDRLYVDLIQEGLERVGGIARRVLDFSPKQIEALPFCLADAVEGARGLVDHRLKRQEVAFEVDVSADLPCLMGDRHEFQQVLLNLFINSLDVFSSARNTHWIRVGAVLDGEMIAIEVSDNGPGMAAEDLRRVFDPFFSGKGKPDASGIGMFISYQIVENHGGVMELHSELGKGFRVSIRMPVAPEA